MDPSGEKVPLHFLVPGFSKCGTTTLCQLLGEHPALFVPGPGQKEPWFFSHYFEQGWESYREFYLDAPASALLGEGSTTYTGIEGETAARQRILEHYPDIRLIFIARDPFDRIESSYREFHHSGVRFGVDCPYDLGEAIDKFPQILWDSAYAARLDNYRQHMPQEQILTVLLEDLTTDPTRVLRQCFKFLGVDPNVTIPDIARRANEGESKFYDTPELRRMRKRRLSPDTALPLSRIPLITQDQFLVKLGLRKPFGHTPVAWPKGLRDRVIEQIGADATRFLAMLGRDVSVWPRFAAALAEHADPSETPSR